MFYFTTIHNALLRIVKTDLCFTSVFLFLMIVCLSVICAPEFVNSTNNESNPVNESMDCSEGDISCDISRERSYPTPYASSSLLPMLLRSLAVQKHSPRTETEIQQEYDYIIVGAGSAGSVVATRLTEIPYVNVLLLEAGPSPPRLTEIPAISRSFFHTDIDWNYTTVPQKFTGAGLNDRKVPWLSGKSLGGSSIWNAMLYLRGNRRNYDEWARLGAKGWSYKEVFPYFLKLENNTDLAFLADGYHATGGPITVSKPSYDPEKKMAEIQAVMNVGYKFVDPNSREQVGIYDYQADIRIGQRCSTAKAYLVPAENRTNLDILSNAMVRKIHIEKKKAVGVEFDFNGTTRHVRAKREVIMSAGTVNTAQLLMLSGIGPTSELKKHNIKVVADLPVGMNFQDHPAAGLYYVFDRPTHSTRVPTFDEDIRNETNIYDYIDNRKGALTSCEGVHLLAFLSNPDSNNHLIPDHCLYLSDFSTIVNSQNGYTPEVLSKFFIPLEKNSTVSCLSQLVHPFSRGTVSIQSANPYDHPLIDPNYLSDPRDVKDIVEGLKQCAKILSDPAMKSIGARPPDIPFPGCEEYLEEDDLYFTCIARSVVLTLNHQVGTAKMGDPNDPTTVVDHQLRVKGVKSLRVVDASVMPTIPWSNTNIPTIMIAEKASDMIKNTIQRAEKQCE